MSILQDILNLNFIENLEYKFKVSERLKDENNNVLEFTIKPLSFTEFNELKRKATTFDKYGKPIINESLLNTLIVIENTVDPCFKDAKSIEKLGCVTPEQYLNKVLLAGEIENLIKQILKISGFLDDTERLIDDIKN